MATYGVSNDGATTYELVNGTWQIVSSPSLAAQVRANIEPGQTGEIPPVTPPRTPPPIVGTIPTAGIPPTGGIGGVPNPWLAGSPQYMEERYGNWPGFGTALGLFGRQYLNPAEQYTAGLYPSTSQLYDIAGRMATRGGLSQYAPGGLYSEWAPQYAQNPFAMYGLAKKMMGSLFGMTPEQGEAAGMTYGLTPSEAGGEGTLGNLLSMALRNLFGRNTAGWLANRLPSMQSQWLGQYPEQGAGAPSFLDYVKQKYNLGAYF